MESNFVPYVEGLREAVEEKEGRSRAGFQTVDCDARGNGNVEFCEAWEHLGRGLRGHDSCILSNCADFFDKMKSCSESGK